MSDTKLNRATGGPPAAGPGRACRRCGRSGGELTEAGCPTHGPDTVVETTPDWTTAPASAWRAITLKGPWDFPIVAPFARPGIAPWSVMVPRDPATLPEAKWCENRTWPTGHRGPLLIHSGKGWDTAGEQDPRVAAMWRAACPPGLRLRREAWTWAGFVTAAAQLVDCHPAVGGCCRPWGHDRPGTHHLILSDVRVLTEPVATVGRQRMWQPAPDLVEAVRSQIPKQDSGGPTRPGITDPRR